MISAGTCTNNGRSQELTRNLAKLTPAVRTVSRMQALKNVPLLLIISGDISPGSNKGTGNNDCRTFSCAWVTTMCFIGAMASFQNLADQTN